MNIPDQLQPFDASSHAPPPTSAQWQAFWQTALQSSGIVSLSAGVIFFLAANWQQMSAWQRFGLFEALFLICAAMAWFKPPSHVVGIVGLTGLTVLTGVLFGLFGQTFQTGANTYELFFAWAALSLPFVGLSRQPGLWAFWSVILNLALTLFAETQSRWGLWLDFGHGVNWLVLGGINLMLAWAFLSLLHSRWLCRLSTLVAAGYITAGSLTMVFGSDNAQISGIIYLVACAAMFLFGWQSKPKDIFPITLLAMNLIITSTALFARLSDMGEIVLFFALSFWVLASTGVAFSLLLKQHRQWESQAKSGAALR